MNTFKTYFGVGLVSLLSYTAHCQSQGWQQLIGEFQTQLSSATVESSPNQYMVAYTALMKDQKKERFLVRLDGKGSESLLVPLNADFDLNGLCRTKDNQIILLSGKQSSKSIEIFGIDENATELWSKKIDIPIAGGIWKFEKMIPTSDGGFALLAAITLGQNMNSFGLLRFDAQGTLLGLNNYYFLEGDEEAKGFMQSNDGSFWITYNKGNITHLLKTDNKGKEILHRTYNDRVNQILFSNGEYLLAGSKTIYKIDEYNGEVKWSKSYCQGDEECYQISSLASRKEGGFVITENKVNGQGNIDIYMTEIDVKGNKTKSYILGSSNNEKANGEVRPTLDGGYLILGESSDIAYTKSHVLLIKTALSSILGAANQEIEYGKTIVVPNPMSSEATIVIQGEAVQKGIFSLYNIQGQLELQLPFEGNNIHLERGQLASGLHTFVIKSESKKLNIGKIIIE